MPVDVWQAFHGSLCSPESVPVTNASPFVWSRHTHTCPKRSQPTHGWARKGAMLSTSACIAFVWHRSLVLSHVVICISDLLWRTESKATRRMLTIRWSYQHCKHCRQEKCFAFVDSRCGFHLILSLIGCIRAPSTENGFYLCVDFTSQVYFYCAEQWWVTCKREWKNETVNT